MSGLALDGVKRGDTVVVVYYGHRRSDSPQVTHEEVVAAGPKYVSTARCKFHRSTGSEVTGYTATRRAFASESEWLLHQHENEVRSALGRAVRDLRVYSIPLDDAKRILAAIVGGAS